MSSPVTENKLSNADDIPAADADSDVMKKVVGMEGKASEPPKDPREDPIGWVNSLIPGAVHKVNYRLLDWIQQLAIEDENKRQVLPGKSNSVTKNQFLSFLRDGSLLAKLANRLQPGTIETIHEGEAAKDKANQTSNINAFINFVKEKSGLSEEQIFTAADLQDKGKAGYQAVFNTLMQLALKAQSTFQQKAIDVEQVIHAASQVVPTNLVQTILNFFKRAQPTQVAEEKQSEEQACKKVDAQGGAVAAH